MSIGLIGTKIGMTREFMDSGQSVPVTVIKVEKGRVLDVITKEKRGYSAVKIGFFKLKNSKLTKQMKGYFAKKNTEPKKILKDFLVEDFGEGFVNREKKGFVFDLENWIFSNYELIKENLDSGILSNHIDLNKLKYLKVYKSRINAHRIWKLFVLERFLQQLSLN